MTEKTKPQNVWVPCSECGGSDRKHEVLHEHQESNSDEYTYYGESYHQLLQCMGCGTVRYRRFMMDENHRDKITGHPVPHHVEIFPKSTIGQRANSLSALGASLIPTDVLKMYEETVAAVNANALTLAGGGLRATVEAICLNQGIVQGSLEKKINALVVKQLLTNAQGDLLHEERYIGNAALHEMATPTKEDIEDGLQIVEGLVATIYILPEKAKRLKKVREKATRRRKSKPASQIKTSKGND